MSETSRLFGLFFEPVKTFTDIAARPRWLVPLLLVCLANLAFFITFGQRVGWSTFLQQQTESNPVAQRQMQQMTPEQRARFLAVQEKAAPLSAYAGAVIGTSIVTLISAGMLFGLASGVMSAGVRFKQVFAIQCYAGLTGVIARALAIVVMFLKPPEDFNLANPLGFNPAAYMDPAATSRFLYTILTGMDLFIFWALLLAVIGLKAAAGKRLGFGGALFVVALPWAFMLFVGASMAAMFS